MFTFFGQFFDHGVDQTVKGGGTVFVPLKGDDPLRRLGPDGKRGHRRRGDPNRRRFMVLTRAKNQPGPDGVRPATDVGNADGCDESADDVQDGEQHRLPVGRPEPDLHLARLAPGVPARVRRWPARPVGDRQLLGGNRRRRVPGRRDVAAQPTASHGDAWRRGLGQEAGGRAAGHQPRGPGRA